jgi:hypothetical protein
LEGIDGKAINTFQNCHYSQNGRMNGGTPFILPFCGEISDWRRKRK